MVSCEEIPYLPLTPPLPHEVSAAATKQAKHKREGQVSKGEGGGEREEGAER